MAAPGEPPTLSLLVLNHNYGRFLGACLDSVLAQTWRDYELIVLDDASTDDSAVVLAACAADPRVRVVRHERNQGFTASLVEGTETHSRGEFLMVLSADDLALDCEAFATQIGALRADPTLVACFSAYVKLGPGQARSTRRPLAGRTEGPALVRALLGERECSLLHSGAIVRAEAYRRAGGYRRDLRNYVDLALWVALGCLGPVACLERPLYGYRVHAGQLSASGARRRETLREGIRVLNEAVRAAGSTGIDLRPAAVLRARIADLALADAFAGRRRRALQRCGDALAVAPLAALTASGWWLALARSLAGNRAWALLAHCRRRA